MRWRCLESRCFAVMLTIRKPPQGILAERRSRGDEAETLDRGIDHLSVHKMYLIWPRASAVTRVPSRMTLCTIAMV